MNTVIVDDEDKSRALLKALLKSYCPFINVVGEAYDIESAFNIIREQNPVLVFLDVQMPGGNAFQLLKKFDSIPFQIIFVTSFDKYAISAIKFSAIDYL